MLCKLGFEFIYALYYKHISKVEAFDFFSHTFYEPLIIGLCFYFSCSSVLALQFGFILTGTLCGFLLHNIHNPDNSDVFSFFSASVIMASLKWIIAYTFLFDLDIKGVVSSVMAVLNSTRVNEVFDYSNPAMILLSNDIANNCRNVMLKLNFIVVWLFPGLVSVTQGFCQYKLYSTKIDVYSQLLYENQYLDGDSSYQLLSRLDDSDKKQANRNDRENSTSPL